MIGHHRLKKKRISVASSGKLNFLSLTKANSKRLFLRPVVSVLIDLLSCWSYKYLKETLRRHFTVKPANPVGDFPGLTVGQTELGFVGSPLY